MADNVLRLIRKGDKRMRACHSQVLLLLCALCFIMMLSALVIGPEGSPAADGTAVDGAVTRIVEDASFWPVFFTGFELGERSLPPAQQVGEDFASRAAGNGERGTLPYAPAGLSPFFHLLATLNIMGAPPKDTRLRSSSFSG